MEDFEDQSILELLVASGPPDEGAIVDFVSGYCDQVELHDELVRALAEYTGSLEVTSSILARIPALRSLDAAEILESIRLETEVRTLFWSRADLADLVPAIAALEPSMHGYWLTQAAGQFPLLQTTLFALKEPSTIAAALLAAALPNGALLQCEALLSLDMTIGQVADALSLLGHDIDLSNAARSVPLFYAGELAAQHRCPAPALRLIGPPLHPAAWLAHFKAAGLAPSAAVLHLREQYHCFAPLDLVRHMVAADFANDLLEALQKNGFATGKALAALAENGWHVDRMVSDLLDRGLLASEVRDHLVQLGLTIPAVRDVLLRHVEPEVADLVVPV